MLDLIKSSAEILKNNVSHLINKQNLGTSDSVQSCIKEVHEKGFFVVKNFLNDKECKVLRKEVDQIMEKYKDKVWVGDKEADKRAFGIERVSENISNNFYYNSFIKEVREAYYSLEDKHIVGCTMANKITPIEGNLGSGGGWHRDSVNLRQFKTILYLSDVDIKNGPFQYLEGTQFKKSVIDGILKHQFRHNHNRFTQGEINKIKEEKKYPERTFLGKAGTLLLVDTSGIHRGMPIFEKNRYALTNYYWISKEKGGKGMYNEVSKMLIA